MPVRPVSDDPASDGTRPSQLVRVEKKDDAFEGGPAAVNSRAVEQMAGTSGLELAKSKDLKIPATDLQTSKGLVLCSVFLGFQ